MRMTSEQFLQLESSLKVVHTSLSKADAVMVSKQLMKIVQSPFYSKKTHMRTNDKDKKYLRIRGPLSYKVVYAFYFSSEFDINFFKIKYPEIIL